MRFVLVIAGLLQAGWPCALTPKTHMEEMMEDVKTKEFLCILYKWHIQ